MSRLVWQLWVAPRMSEIRMSSTDELALFWASAPRHAGLVCGSGPVHCAVLVIVTYKAARDEAAEAKKSDKLDIYWCQLGYTR